MGILLAVSVGGTKIQLGLVDIPSGALRARSARVEWARQGASGLAGFTSILVREIESLVRSVGMDARGLTGIGVAWPGPGANGRFEASFIPGCDTRQPVAAMLREQLCGRFGNVLAATPIVVCLDASVRAAGESRPEGALHGAPAGLLINIATGIAGASVVTGELELSHGDLGETYGQFGRYLFRDHREDRWVWSPTPDGSVPPHPSWRTRWTRYSGGPALAGRIARRCAEVRYETEEEAFANAIDYCRDDRNPRDPVRERIILEALTRQARSDTDSPFPALAEEIASDMAGAIACLLDVLDMPDHARIVLAGGVGENLMRPAPAEPDTWLARIQTTIPRPASLARARMGVSAEFVGFCSSLLLSRAVHPGDIDGPS